MNQGRGSLCSQSTHRTDTTKALPKLQNREWPTPQPRRNLENRYTLGLATTPFQTSPRKAKYDTRKGTQKVVLRDLKLAAGQDRRGAAPSSSGLQAGTPSVGQWPPTAHPAAQHPWGRGEPLFPPKGPPGAQPRAGRPEGVEYL